MHHPTERITHTTAFVTPVVEHWLEREIAQWVERLSYLPNNLKMTNCMPSANALSSLETDLKYDK